MRVGLGVFVAGRVTVRIEKLGKIESGWDFRGFSGIFGDFRRGPIPLRGEELVLAGQFRLQRPAVRKMAAGSEFTPRRQVENRLTHQFRRLARNLGLDGVSLHSLRHSCASRMVIAGVPLSAVARVTGHSTLRCAALYGKHAPQDAAKMAIRALEEAGNGGVIPDDMGVAEPVA